MSDQKRNKTILFIIASKRIKSLGINQEVKDYEVLPKNIKKRKKKYTYECPMFINQKP